MFFTDRVQALAEIQRVLRPAGEFAVAVWGSLERTLGYRAMVALLQQLFGDAVANRLHAP